MKTNHSKWYIILGILFVAINTIIFAIPSQKTYAFWITYVFLVLSFITQIFLWHKLITKDKELKSKFLGLPLIIVGIIYLIIQIIITFVFLFFPHLPIWSSIIACAINSCISTICLIAISNGKEQIEQIDNKIKQKTNFINSIQIDLELLSEKEDDETVKPLLKNLAEKIRYSDPMSNEQLSDLENTIIQKIGKIKTAKNKKEIIKEIDLLIIERNKKCKLLK